MKVPPHHHVDENTPPWNPERSTTPLKYEPSAGHELHQGYHHQALGEFECSNQSDSYSKNSKQRNAMATEKQPSWVSALQLSQQHDNRACPTRVFRQPYPVRLTLVDTIHFTTPAGVPGIGAYTPLKHATLRSKTSSGSNVAPRVLVELD